MSPGHSRAMAPPQQARSRAALQRILEAAEEILAAGGVDDFAMATVAERAGVSVGAVYRRFTGKDQLLDAVKDRFLSRLESNLAEALAGPHSGIGDVVDVFTWGMVDAFSAGSQVFPALLSPLGPEGSERGLHSLATMQRMFLDAAVPHLADVRRPEPMTALVTTVRTIMGACIHRTVVVGRLPDGVAWPTWAEQISAMSTLYLTASDSD